MMMLRQTVVCTVYYERIPSNMKDKNMKPIYIILTPIIKDVGGGQIYALNKVHFLRKCGFDTYIFHAGIGKSIVIEEMRQYSNCKIDEMKFPAQYYSCRKQNRILNRIKDKIQFKESQNEIYIESHTVTCATWGELFAEHLFAKHIIFLLSEYPKIESSDYFKFLHYKFERRELAGISKTSLKTLFSNWMTIDEGKCYRLLAFCSNVLGNITYKVNLPFDKYDYVIGSIGRLEKPFLLQAIRDISYFANKYKDKKILLVLIGGSSKSYTRKIIKEASKIDNLSLHITGNIYPIPISLINKIHVFVSVAGSCKVSTVLGKLTISYDVNDLSPIGIVGYTTRNTVYRANGEPIISLTSILEDIFIYKKYKENAIPVNVDGLNDFDFTPHIDFISDGEKCGNAYKINLIRLSVRDKLKIICIKSLGINVFYYLKTLLLK